MDGFAKDLIGQRFDRLLVLERAPNQDGLARWRCQCDCGTVVVAYGYLLRRGSVRSCGCLQRDLLRKRTVHDLAGQRFGRLTVVAAVPPQPRIQRRWQCQCDCGGAKQVETGALLSGGVRSCGCLQQETRRANPQKRIPDLVGLRVGRLRVIERASTPPGKQGAWWRCQCDCGTERCLPTSTLKRGAQKSCGCLQRERHAQKDL